MICDSGVIFVVTHARRAVSRADSPRALLYAIFCGYLHKFMSENDEAMLLLSWTMRERLAMMAAFSVCISVRSKVET